MKSVNIKDTEERVLRSLCCLYFYLWTGFTYCSGVLIINFEQKNPGKKVLGWDWTCAELLHFPLNLKKDIKKKKPDRNWILPQKQEYQFWVSPSHNVHMSYRLEEKLIFNMTNCSNIHRLFFPTSRCFLTSILSFKSMILQRSIVNFRNNFFFFSLVLLI